MDKYNFTRYTANFAPIKRANSSHPSAECVSESDGVVVIGDCGGALTSCDLRVKIAALVPGKLDSEAAV